MTAPALRTADALRLSFALSALLCLAVAQIWITGSSRVSTLLPGLAFNACVVVALCGFAELLRRARVPTLMNDVLFYTLLTAICTLVFAHTWCFDVAIERRLTLLDLTRAGSVYFFRQVLPARGYVALLAFVSGVLATGMLFARVLRSSFSYARVLTVLVFGMLFVLPLVLRARQIPSPLFDSAEEIWQLASRPKLEGGSSRSRPELRAVLDKSERTRLHGSPRFDKVIVLVMETMTAAKLEQESARLSDATFLRRERARSHRFTRYFPNNQDSRTGMLDMLFSRLIPFEAYSDEGYRGYRELAGQRSLVDELRAHAYSTAFAVSQTSLEEVVDGLAWDRTLRLSEPQMSEALARKQLCFTPDEYEQSCEDLVLLPQVVEFVATHERAFVYQEFIWGHAYEYNAASGRTNADYYSSYVDALLLELQKRGLAERTLIALTSDHGFRDRGRQGELEVYRVPLLFHAAGFAPRTDARLLSHSDFGMLLFEELSPSAPRADDNPFVLIVGPTGQGNVFAVGREGGELLLRHKAGLDLVISERGPWRDSPSALFSLFRDYRAHFVATLREPSVHGK
jgi:hypothetical protein